MYAHLRKPIKGPPLTFMNTETSKQYVHTVKFRLRQFLEDMNTPGYIYQVKEAQAKFYGYIRSCVELFWHRETTEDGPYGSSESWKEEITMSHEEAIQKIKEDVIPCLAKAKSLLDRNEYYVRVYGERFENLCAYIEDFFAFEKQAEGNGETEKRRAAEERQQRVSDLLKELWDLFVKSNDTLSRV